MKKINITEIKCPLRLNRCVFKSSSGTSNRVSSRRFFRLQSVHSDSIRQRASAYFQILIQSKNSIVIPMECAEIKFYANYWPTIYGYAQKSTDKQKMIAKPNLVEHKAKCWIKNSSDVPPSIRSTKLFRAKLRSTLYLHSLSRTIRLHVMFAIDHDVLTWILHHTCDIEKWQRHQHQPHSPKFEI